MQWIGVMPAMTTAFHPDLSVDHEFIRRHADWMLSNGCTGLVMLGSLGEGATLSDDEKIAILRAIVRSVDGRAPVVAAISSLSTANAVRLAKAADQAGCNGLMVLPPYVYSSDWRACLCDHRRYFAFLHALQQPCCLQDGLPAGADGGTRG